MSVSLGRNRGGQAYGGLPSLKQSDDKGTIALIHGNQTVQKNWLIDMSDSRSVSGRSPSVTVLKEMNCDNNAFRFRADLFTIILSDSHDLNGVVSVGDWPLQEASSRNKTPSRNLQNGNLRAIPKAMVEDYRWHLLRVDRCGLRTKSLEKAMKMCLATAQGEVDGDKICSRRSRGHR